MVTETVIETPVEVPADPAPPNPAETETPPAEEAAEGAAPAEEAAAAPEPEQATVVETKPDYITREEWEKERAEVATKAAQAALEEDRRRRQTEGARKAQSEERAKQRLAQTVDTVKATLVARGFDPEVATDESVLTAIDRVSQQRAESLLAEQADLIGQSWDWITAQIYDAKVERTDEMAPLVEKLAPRVQHLIETVRPLIEAEARKGYTPDSELPKIREAAVAAHNAKQREGQTDLARVDGQPSNHRSDAEILADPTTPIATLKAIRDRQKQGG